MAWHQAPQLYDHILILREPWLRLILNGEKVLEIRGRPLSPGWYWLGCKSMIYGVARLGSAIKIDTVEAWRTSFTEHRVDLPDPPYRTTYGLPILSSRPTRAFRYVHPRGAIGVVKYRPG